MASSYTYELKTMISDLKLFLGSLKSSQDSKLPCDLCPYLVKAFHVCFRFSMVLLGLCSCLWRVDSAVEVLNLDKNTSSPKTFPTRS